ncbi:ECA oligosaccharide polymerase [Otariodibacter oris]|uniref:Antigen polymerase n=1 Tax=Otariodibacter oris TaxID=1032623 RepID=A0A420XEJ3_9PAST|nr:ECA oligosaccharide polymerase [Otariodibacter oris]QGM80162.1 enterobacterial common antigen polymerase [Otariodibacter oris]RKR70511.1 antigen polymerase [Otariodibacter oris]
MPEFMLLSVFYLLAILLIGTIIYRSYHTKPFSLHLLFSLIYLITFFLGFPFSLILNWKFGVALADKHTLFLTLLYALCGYLIYFVSYHWGLSRYDNYKKEIALPSNNAKFEAKLTAYLLFFIAIVSVGYFLFLNGFLLFRLEKYSQIFSNLVQGIALKRFFYFFLPALLIFYFCSKTKKAWWSFLIVGVSFGVLTYLAVGGTRANIALVVTLFLLLGLYHRYLSVTWIFVAGSAMVLGMFYLALFRYNLDVQGEQMWFTFLYLTRDTFSPWENLSRILSSDVEFQGLMPIVRDFYVYIPQSIWPDRPDIAWNTANYFTKVILGNQSGLAISPTILGSFYLMGGIPMIIIGMGLTGILIKLGDNIFDYARLQGNRSYSAILQAYCLANIFNLIILVREGSDAFVSRFFFFSFVFWVCWMSARFIQFLIHSNKGEL